MLVAATIFVTLCSQLRCFPTNCCNEIRFSLYPLIMPKTSSDRLFRLIKSLSATEKRYFKVFISAGGSKENKYAALFDAIDAQDVFDDDALRHLVYGRQPLQSRKYSELKSYLYELVLKSLQAYDENSSIDFKIKGLLQSVRALYKRAHFDDCLQLLVKAGKLAQEYEKFGSQLEVLQWEKQVAYSRGDINGLDKRLAEIEAEETLCAEQLRNLNAYQNLFYESWLSIRKNALRPQPEGAEYSLSQHPLLQDERHALSHQARVLYYRVRSIFSYAHKDYSGFYESSRLLISIMETRPLMLREDVSEYISALSNYSVSCGYLGDYEGVRECLKKLRNVQPNTRDDELKIHRQYYTNAFRLYIVTGAFEEGLKTLEQHLEEAQLFDKEQFERSSFYFQYFYIYFGAGDFNKALDYLNEWLRLPRSVERQDLQSLARILNLIIHYEMDNHLLLDSLLRSTHRFLNQHKSMLLFEVSLIHFLRKAIKASQPKEVLEALEHLRRDFETLSENPAENAMLQLFDFKSWIESKLTNKAFSSIVEEKYKQGLVSLKP